ncbi:MAG: hypothetical protein OEQ53_06255, partial [Saprospiraceae bacterium]|nr:hypothetical protein [Saprospiraceae bacterium]
MTWQKLRLRKPRTIAVPPFMLVFFFGMQLHAQPFDLVITNGHVIDPKNEINVPMDIAIVDGRIAQVEKEISPSLAKQVVDATDLIVAPGFIDIHTHVFVGPKPKT